MSKTGSSKTRMPMFVMWASPTSHHRLLYRPSERAHFHPSSSVNWRCLTLLVEAPIRMSHERRAYTTCPTSLQAGPLFHNTGATLGFTDPLLELWIGRHFHRHACISPPAAGSSFLRSRCRFCIHTRTAGTSTSVARLEKKIRKKEQSSP